MKVKETAKKPYGICPASMTIWNADQTYNKKGMEKYLTWPVSYTHLRAHETD